MFFAIGQALRQQGGDALQSEVHQVAKETTLGVSEGRQEWLSCVQMAVTVCVSEAACVPPLSGPVWARQPGAV